MQGLQHNTDNAARTVVQYALYGFTEFILGVRRHADKLLIQSLPHQLVEGFSEYLRIPQQAGVGGKARKQVFYQLLGLVLRTDGGGDFRVHIHPEYVPGGCTGFQPDTILPALPHHGTGIKKSG